MEQARERLRAINASSIKKVGEAKARKARRRQRALTKIKKKANAIASKEDLSEREKVRRHRRYCSNLSSYQGWQILHLCLLAFY